MGKNVVLKDYIITTPVKNEGANIEQTIQTIINQSFKPKYWIIIDDHSNDDTCHIIKRYQEDNPWIILRKSPFEQLDKYSLGFHIARLKSFGLELGVEIAQEQGFDLHYLCIVDADIYLSSNFFKRFLHFLNTNEQYGIVGPHFVEQIFHNRRSESMVSSGAMIISKDCYDDIDGIVISMAFDSATCAKAIIKGWTVRRLNLEKAEVLRQTCSGDGLINGYFYRGESDRYLGWPLYIILIKFVMNTMDYNLAIGIAYLKGFFSYRKEGMSIKDSEPQIYHYFHVVRPVILLYEFISRVSYKFFRLFSKNR